MEISNSQAVLFNSEEHLVTTAACFLPLFSHRVEQGKEGGDKKSDHREPYQFEGDHRTAISV